MKTLKTLLSSATTFLLLAGAPALLAQDPPVRVEVTSTNEVWYLDPVWLGIGGVVFLIVVMAARGRDSGTSTTVVR